MKFCGIKMNCKQFYWYLMVSMGTCTFAPQH